MKNKTILCATLLLASSLFAKDNLFLGVEYGVNKSQYTEYSYSAARIGKYFDDYRVYVSLSENSAIGANIDYLFLQEESSFTPYIGAGYHYGFRHITYRYTNGNSYEDSNSFYAIDFNGGTTYRINKEFELDANCGFRYLSSSNDLLPGEGLNINIGIGINYLFSSN